MYEEPYTYLHIKSIDIDEGRFLTIGSMNQDHCSFYQNNEANIVFEDLDKRRKFYQDYANIYNRLRRECLVVDPNESYSFGGYIENKFWRFALFMTRVVCANRQVT